MICRYGINCEDGYSATFEEIISPSMFLKKVLYYINPLNFFKKDSGDLNLRFMHGINKISIMMFLICVVVLLVKWLTR